MAVKKLKSILWVLALFPYFLLASTGKYDNTDVIGEQKIAESISGCKGGVNVLITENQLGGERVLGHANIHFVTLRIPKISNYPAVLAHELGHRFGYVPKNPYKDGKRVDTKHAAERTNLMYPTSFPQRIPEPDQCYCENLEKNLK